MNVSRKTVIRGVTVLYMLFIFFLSSMPAPPAPLGGGFFISSLEHFIEYAVLGFFLLCSFGPDAFLLAFGIACIFALSDEFHQLFVPGRSASFLDVLVDFSGAFLGVFSRARMK